MSVIKQIIIGRKNTIAMIGFLLILTATAVFAEPTSNQDRQAAVGSPGAVAADDCFTTGNCLAAVTIRAWVNVYTFQIRSTGGVYVAVGLSDDMSMGNDSIVECVRDEAAGPGNVSLYSSFNTGRENRREADATGITLDTEASYYDEDSKTAYCKFTREEVTVVQGVEFDLFRTEFHLLLAAGTDATADNIKYHDIAKGANPIKGYVEEYGYFEIP